MRPRSASLIALALAAFLVSGCEHEECVRHFQRDVPETLVIDTGSGDVWVQAAPIDRVEVTVVGPEDSEPQSRVSGDTLYLSSDPGEIYVLLPPEVRLVVDTGSGAVHVEGMSSSVEVDTGSGDVEIEEIAGPRLVVDTGSGRVRGHRLEVEKIAADTGSGNVVLDLSETPQEVQVEVGSGDMQLYLPRNAYRVVLDTGSGDSTVRGIEYDAGSPHTLDLRSGSGDIDVTGY